MMRSRSRYTGSDTADVALFTIGVRAQSYGK